MKQSNIQDNHNETIYSNKKSRISRKYSAIQNYMRKIQLIKFDRQKPNKNNFSNRGTTICQSNKVKQNTFERSIYNDTNKRRCISMKQQQSPQLNQNKHRTLYNKRFNATNIKIRTEVNDRNNENRNKQNDRNRTFSNNFNKTMTQNNLLNRIYQHHQVGSNKIREQNILNKTMSNSNNRRLLISNQNQRNITPSNKYHHSRNKTYTQPYDTFYKTNQLNENSQYQNLFKVNQQHFLSNTNQKQFSIQINQNALEQNIKKEEQDMQKEQQNMQKAKNQILSKISLYVKQLDEKGQNQLNEMLTNQYRKRIRFHYQAYLYEQRIKQMIQVNKQIVFMLKQQLLNPANPISPLNKTNPSFNLKKNIFNSTQNIHTQLFDSHQNIINQSNNKILIDNRDSNIQQNSHKSNKQPNNQQSKHNTFKQTTLQQTTMKQQKDLNTSTVENQAIKDIDYQNEVQTSTKQFMSQWNKSQNHKKTLYQKFKHSLFKKYPQFKQRQRKLKQQKLPKNKKLSPLSDDQQDFQFDHQINQINQFNKNQQDKKPYQNKNLFNTKIQNQSIQLNKNISKQNKENKQSKQKNQKSVNYQFKTSQAFQLKRSLSKITNLSKKNSISKGSTKNLDLLASEDKYQVAKINFQNLIEFIFKRAFFYSISKKKVIQNKAPYGQMRYTPRVQKRDPNISFMNYNKSMNQKKYLKNDKLNEKKLKATGNYLIKNKYKIMDLQKQGNKSFDFLKKCLDDAIQDYLKSSKTK